MAVVNELSVSMSGPHVEPRGPHASFTGSGKY